MAEYYCYECPTCGQPTTVYETRRVEYNGHPAVIRARECSYCDNSFRTYEMPVAAFRSQLAQYAKLKEVMRPFFEQDQSSAKSEKVEQSAGPKKAEATDEDNSWKTTGDDCS